MPYNTKSNVKDADNKPVASYFNADNDTYEAINGMDGATFYHQKGSLIIDFIEGEGANTHTFAEPVRGLYLKNTSDSDLSFTVNGKTATLDPDESFQGLFRDTFTQLTVNAIGKYKGHINE